MSFKLETARGVRDILPDEQLLREHVLAVLQKQFRLFGFQPLDTPVIERFDVLAAKFAAGEDSDAMSETYRLQDNGGRELALRFDLTVPLSRFVGMNRTMALPFSRYQIGTVYRDAPVRKGRYREFTQCDADIVGSDSLLAEVTCIQLALAVYKELGMDVCIRVNNRQFLNDLLSFYGVEDIPSVLIIIDKFDKIGQEGVLKLLQERSVARAQEIVDALFQGSTQDDRFTFFENLGMEQTGLFQLKTLLSFFSEKEVTFQPYIARGLGYYTGTVFEVDTPALDSSIAAGGRYDNLINDYLDAAGISSPRRYPSVGISFGLDRMVDVLQAQGFSSQNIAATRILLVSLDQDKTTINYAQELRAKNIPTAIDMSGKKLGKIFQYADQQGIPFVGVIGEEEVSSSTVSLKELSSGEQESLSLPLLIEKVSLYGNNERM